MAMDTQKILESLLLPKAGDWVIESVEKDDPNERIDVKVRYTRSVITVAGQDFPIYDFRHERTWRHLDLWQSGHSSPLVFLGTKLMARHSPLKYLGQIQGRE